MQAGSGLPGAVGEKAIYRVQVDICGRWAGNVGRDRHLDPRSGTRSESLPDDWDIGSFPSGTAGVRGKLADRW